MKMMHHLLEYASSFILKYRVHLGTQYNDDNRQMKNQCRPFFLLYHSEPEYSGYDSEENKINKISNHVDPKISTCAELVPKSFSINVATPIDIANSKR